MIVTSTERAVAMKATSSAATATSAQTRIREARRRKVDGVICGHTHQSAMYEMDGILYCNTGDWVEGATALVETTTGELRLLNWEEELERQSEQARGPVPADEPVEPIDTDDHDDETSGEPVHAGDHALSGR